MYAKKIFSHYLLKGDVTTSILFTDDDEVIITHTKNEGLKIQGS